MFLNYHAIADNYVPNNTTCSFPKGQSYTKLESIEASKPYEEYNSKGELIGYFWRYGETLNLEFNIDGEITVETDAIILTAARQTPSSAEGKLNQKAYNVTDIRSWTCIQIVDGYRVWSEDNEFTYNPNSTRSIYVSAEDYLKDKYLEFNMYNFRFEKIYTKVLSGTTKAVINIDKELSRKMNKGIYYCSLSVVDDYTCLPIFTSKDCTLLVK